MAENTIDTLQIQLESDSKSAVSAIDDLINSLGGLQKVMSGLDFAELSSLASGVKKFAGSMAELKGGGASLKEVAEGMRALSDIEATQINSFTNGMKSLGKTIGQMKDMQVPDLSGVNGLLQNIKGLENINPNETGIDKLVRSIKNLATANVAGFDTSKFDRIVAGVRDFGNIPDVSSSVNRFVASIARLANAGDKITAVSLQLPKLGEALKDITSSFTAVPAISESTNMFVQAIAQLSSVGEKARKTAENLGILSDELLNFFQTMSKAPSINQNVIQMTQALAQLSAAGGRTGVASRSLTASFSMLPASTAKAKKGFSGLAGAIGKFYATYWLVIRGMNQLKKAINISSDLTEVQNVVDVTFGDMADKMNEFASSALQNYGMSELTAKQLGGRFQAMGTAMGIPMEKMTDMSIALTGLTGDMASFYNESQESVGKALQSIFTGETEPLRRFGIDLSQATVEAWALSNGLNADMQNMTQMEKALLRYEYATYSAGAANGDFLRTINSWENQVRLLTGSFEQLGSVIGGTLINAFKPFVRALNSVMGAVINFAKVVSEALGAIFGWEYQVGGGITDDLEASAGAAGSLDSSMGGAADKAKKLKSYLLGIDELNVLEPDTDSKDSGGAGGGSGTADGGQWVQTEALWEKYTSSIESLGELGEYIGDTLTNALAGINWEEVHQGAEDFGSGLASFLNDLISTELFGEVGTSIAGALNTVLHGLDSFGTNFNWENFGFSVAEGINQFFDEFNFALLADTIDVWVQGLWTALKTALLGDENGEGGIDWSGVYDGIKDFLEHLDVETVEILIGAFAIKGLTKEAFRNKILTTIGGSIVDLGKTTFKLGLAAISGLTKGGFKSKILEVIGGSTTLNGLKFILEGYTIGFVGGPAIDVVGNKIIDLVDEFIRNNFGESVVNAMGEGLLLFVTTGAGAILGGPIGAAIGAGIGIALDTFVVKGEWITKFWNKLSEVMFNFSFSNDLLEKSKKFFDNAFNADNFLEFGENIIAGIASGLTAGVSFLVEPIFDLFNFVIEKICGVFGIHSPAEETKFIGTEIINGIIQGFLNAIPDWLKNIVDWGADTISQFLGTGKDLVENGFNKGIQDNYATTRVPLSKWVNDITKEFTGSGADKAKINSTSFGQFANNAITGFKDWVSGHFGESQSPVASWAAGIVSWFTGDSSGDGSDKTKINTSAFNSFADNAISGFRDWTKQHFGESQSPIDSWAQNIISWFTGSTSGNGTDTGKINTSAFNSFSKNMISGFKDWTNNHFGETENSISSWVKGIISWFTGSDSGNGTDKTKINTSAFNQFSNNIITGFRDWTNSHFGESKGPVDSWVKGIVSWFTGDGKDGGINKVTFTTYAKNVIDAFKNKINTSYMDTKSVMTEWCSKVKEWFWGDSYPSASNGIASSFLDFGKWIIGGLIDGIESLWDAAQNVFEDLCDMVNDVVEKKEEINSPSKRFRRYGEYMMEGLINGVNAESGDVRSAFDNVMSGINDRAESLRLNVPNIDVGAASLPMRSISTEAVVDSRATISIEASLEAAIERVIDERLIPSMRENSDAQSDLLREIANKDTNLYMDGRRMNTMLNARQSRSGFAIKR